MTDTLAEADRKCPLGDDCDLTAAWLAGKEEARGRFRARIEELTARVAVLKEALNWYEEEIERDERKRRAEMKAAAARIRELEEALRWYAEPQIYHPIDGDQRGASSVAIRALKGSTE